MFLASVIVCAWPAAQPKEHADAITATRLDCIRDEQAVWYLSERGWTMQCWTISSIKGQWQLQDPYQIAPVSDWRPQVSASENK